MFNVINKLFEVNYRSPVVTIVRHRRLRKPDPIPPQMPESLAKRLEDFNRVDPALAFKVDIGLPPRKIFSHKDLKDQKKYILERKADLTLEEKSRKLTLEWDMNEIREEWIKTAAPNHIQTVAEHYNIYDDLFGDAYFTPYVIMNINYQQKDRTLIAPVCRGNIVKPSEAASQPSVEFPSLPEELWTMTLVNPDGHLTESNMEYVHWFVGNIPGGDVSKGEVIWDYLPPFPPRGVGFQRFVFILYKQEKKMDYSMLKKQIPCLELKDRSFKTLEFYRERQDNLTPVGLSFFQSDWDKGSRKVFHEILNMEEPVFEYNYEPKVLKEQRWFPKREPFDKYLDRYRDPRDIYKEYLLKRLKEVDPFKPPKKPFPYPRALQGVYHPDTPSWLVQKEDYYRSGLGRVTEQIRDEYE